MKERLEKGKISQEDYEKGRLKKPKSVFQTTFCSTLQACNAQDTFDVAEAGKDAREIVDLFDFQREPHAGFQVAGLGLHGGNVEFVAGERVGDVA